MLERIKKLNIAETFTRRGIVLGLTSNNNPAAQGGGECSRESKRRSIAETFTRRGIVLGRTSNNNPAVEGTSPDDNVK